jgi:hypothetical protein
MDGRAPGYSEKLPCYDGDYPPPPHMHINFQTTILSIQPYYASSIFLISQNSTLSHLPNRPKQAIYSNCSSCSMKLSSRQQEVIPTLPHAGRNLPHKEEVNTSPDHSSKLEVPPHP